MRRSRIFITGLLSLFLSTSLPVNAQVSISVGIFPRHNYGETIRMFFPMSRYLSKELGVPVIFKTAKNFSEFWRNVLANKYDLIHLNQSQYLAAHEQSGYQVLLMNEEFGQATLRSVILVRTDSGINSLEDLKGKNIIFGGNKMAMMSYLIPKQILLDANVMSQDYTTTFARNPPNALMAVILKRADACGIGDALLKTNDIQQRLSSKEIRIIAKSEQIAHLAWATSPNLSAKLRNLIKIALIELKKSEKGLSILSNAKLTGFKEASHTDYAPLNVYTEIVK